MKISHLLRAFCLICVISGAAFAQILLNELDINPGGTDNPCEYVEIIGPPGATVQNLHFVSVEGDSGSTPGVATAVITFGVPGPVLGSNGLLIVTGTQPCGSRTYPAATTVAPVTLLDQAGGALQNGTNSFLFISSTTPIMAGTDYDTDNNGTLESLPAGATIVDGVAWSDGGAGDITYGTVVLSAAGGTIGAATRFPGNTTPNTPAAWYAGAMVGANSDTTYSPTIRTANFPPDGALTPGAPNVGTAVARDAPVDFNGDARTDWVVVRNIGGGVNGQLRWFWNLNNSAAPTVASDWGLNSDVLVPADYDGDLSDDIAIWRPAPATQAAFYILNSQTMTARVETFGQNGDDPTVVADYNGDGRDDLAVYRPSDGIWFYRTTANGATTYVPWGAPGDFPAPGDWNGDGTADFGIQRNNGGAGNFWIRLSNGTIQPVVYFGLASDFIVTSDFDGDGTSDIAVLRAGSNFTWYWRSSSSGAIQQATFGQFGDTPAPGDYDGDGRTDVAVFRSGIFYVQSTASNAITFFTLGSTGDRVPATYNIH